MKIPTQKFSFICVLFCFTATLFPPKSFAFGPCQSLFPDGLTYLPSVAVCDNKAAVVVYDDLYSAYSIVVRDCNNNDRDPCNKGASSCGSNESSPFKAQKIVKAQIKRKGKKFPARIFCLNEAGDSEIYKIVRRITVKKTNPVRTSKDVLKICLKYRTIPIRNIEILTTSAQKDISSTGYSGVCAAQPYLSCDYSYEAICK